MEVTFRPSKSLALRATILNVPLLRRIPVKAYLVLFLLSSGVLLVFDAICTFAGKEVSVGRWLGAVLYMPLLILMGLVASYFHHRFAGPITLKDAGLYKGWAGRVRAQPTECRVKTSPFDPQIHFLTIHVKMLFSKKSRVYYEAVTDNLASAEQFQAAFEKKYRNPSRVE